MKELIAEKNDLNKGDEIIWQGNPSHRQYWVKGKNKEGKDRRWGPFKSQVEANSFKNSRKDIRNPQVAFESVQVE